MERVANSRNILFGGVVRRKKVVRMLRYTCNGGVFEGTLQCQQAGCSTDVLPAGLDSTCANTPVGGSCFVRCPAGFIAAESVYTCQSTGFTGTPPTCDPLVCSSDGLPQDYRLNVSNCIGTVVGFSCQVTCKYGFEASLPSLSIQCASNGSFVLGGNVPSCAPKACAVATNPTWQSDCQGVTHGQTCTAICRAGHSGVPRQFQCENGLLVGAAPNCIALPCIYSGAIGVGLDTSSCEGTTTGSNCSLGCIFGYEGVGDALMTCQSDGSFLRSQFQCQATTCGILSKVSPYGDPEFKDACEGLNFGQTCSVLCETGWDLQGQAVPMLCNNTAAHSEGYGSGGLAAANSTPPSCIAKPCTARLPSLRGSTNDCAGKTTLQSCTVSPSVGFTMTGSSTLQCGTDGEFKGAFPTIQAAVCATPSFGAGVSSTCANKPVGAECWAYCLTGYTGTSQAYRCTADSQGVAIAPVSQAVSCTSTRRLREGRGLTTACGAAAVSAFGLGVQFEHSSQLSPFKICETNHFISTEAF